MPVASSTGPRRDRGRLSPAAVSALLRAPRPRPEHREGPLSSTRWSIMRVTGHGANGRSGNRLGPARRRRWDSILATPRSLSICRTCREGRDRMTFLGWILASLALLLAPGQAEEKPDAPPYATGEAKHYDQYGARIGQSKESGSTTRHYDQYGNRTGRSTKSGSTTRHYDRYGSSVGKSRTSGDTKYHYDRYGRRTGKSRTSGNTTYHYDNYGRRIGKSRK